MKNLSDPFNIKPPRVIECVTRKQDDGRCDIEVEGHVDHVETGEPIKVKSHAVVMYPPKPEDFRSLLVTFFDHEVREQLGMDPHGPVDPVAVSIVKERDEALANFANACDVGRRMEARTAALEAAHKAETARLRSALHRIAAHCGPGAVLTGIAEEALAATE